jgi:hypothetical protein
MPVLFKRDKAKPFDNAGMRRNAESLPEDADRKDLLESIAYLEADEKRVEPFLKAYHEQARRSRRNDLLGMVLLFVIGFAILSFPVRGVLEGRIVDLGNGTDRYLYWNEFPYLFVGLVMAYCAMGAPFLLAGGFMLREDRRIANVVNRSTAAVQARRAQLRTPQQILDAPRPLYPSAVTPEMRRSFARRLEAAMKENPGKSVKQAPISYGAVAVVLVSGCAALFQVYEIVSGHQTFPEVCRKSRSPGMDFCKLQNMLYESGGMPLLAVCWFSIGILLLYLSYLLFGRVREQKREKLKRDTKASNP